MHEMIIQKNDSDQRVDKFLTKALPKLPKSMLYKSIRNKKIKVNRKRCEVSQRLQEGDTIQLFLAEEFFEVEKDRKFLEVSSDINVLYEDEHILVVNKPIGLLAHSDSVSYEDNLIDRIKHYLYDHNAYDPDMNQSFTPSLCHRIDRNTQGIVIAAKDAASLRLMNEKIKARQLDKYYLCIVEGHMPQKQDTITLYHVKDTQKNQAQISKYAKDGYKQIKTGYKVQQQGIHHDLLEVTLYSGRSHQIRATMAFLGHPLLSDVKYGAKKTEYPYQALCAYRICFHFQPQELLSYLDGKTIEIQEPKLVSYFHKKLKNS